MFSFFKKKRRDEDVAASGLATTEAARISTEKAAIKYSKPIKYDRSLIDSGKAKLAAKKQAFSTGEPVTDPYTGDILVLTKSEAKMLYGADWTKHLAESDHTVSLKKVYDDFKGGQWQTTGDIGDAANSQIKVVSRKFNNAKRSRTNTKLVTDEPYLEKTGLELTESGKQAAIQDDIDAQRAINRQMKASARRNILSTGHEAGMRGAEYAGKTSMTITGIMNMVDVINGEKEPAEAIEDTIVAGGKAAASGYVMSGGLTVAAHSLSNSSSAFLRSLANSNIPGQIITAVMVTGDTLKKYGNGEITTQECILELGNKGLTVATAGYSMAVGQALIPIPIVGGAVGALVGTVLTGNLYESLIKDLQIKELEHEERMRIIEECKLAAAQANEYRNQLESYLQNYFQEYQQCFDEALSSIRFSFEAGDANGMIAGANAITRKLGGQVQYESVDEYKGFLDSGSAFIL